MSFLIVVGALFFLMFMAYRGFSVILFAPIAAMLAVLLTDPATVPAMFIGSFAGAPESLDLKRLSARFACPISSQKPVSFCKRNRAPEKSFRIAYTRRRL